MRRKSDLRRMLVNGLHGIGVVFLCAACLTALYYWDPTRVVFKRFTAESQTVYETVAPRFLTPDPASFIHIGNRDSAKSARTKVIEVVWGRAGVPVGEMPDAIVRDLDKREELPEGCNEGRLIETMLKLGCEVKKYTDWENLAGVDELRVKFGPEYVVSIGYFRPQRANGTLVVYQHGFAGTYHAQWRYLERLIAEGYTVAANNMDRYGDNVCGSEDALRWCAPSAGKFEVPFPMRIYFTPITKTINYALQNDGIQHVAMIGFSGGAWIAAVMAAIDRRIERSYPVAGVMPFHMRREKEWPPNQVYPPLMEVADMLDLFVLGASGDGRRQVQFFNRYDRCCYNGPRPLVYEEAVQAAVQRTGGGSFDVVIDETHARHKVSRWTFNRILWDLGALWN